MQSSPSEKFLKSGKSTNELVLRLGQNEYEDTQIAQFNWLNGSVSASEPGGREFYPRLCSCSVFAIICNEFDTANLLQVRFMVTSELSLTCCKLTASLHSCHDKFVANLHSCHDKFVASLLQTKIAIWVYIIMQSSPSEKFLKSGKSTNELVLRLGQNEYEDTQIARKFAASLILTCHGKI
ncbi:hypothetical protein AVEN_151199-1 [Araneus ventricosus]|uniref:Uncharacterized protein n=1 Tax=Araneus ventricosus TaxID=182803 RepID=A0A4Y2BIL1_ARAVE|nr:hypothetical protein AVEN_151199-1 [Araneus ventricosus]